ncbi:MAG: nitronate monooxygenase [Rikenellaceae bacterium]
MKKRVVNLFGIKYPIVSGGMVWCSGHRLASAVSLAGGLGLIGSGSMHLDTLREHIVACRLAVGDLPFGVNIPLFSAEAASVVELVKELEVPVVFTSGGNPSLYTSSLKAAGIKVVHVVASVKFALKAQASGVDALVCEGFEAGGHNGRDEITTMVLTREVAQAVSVPVIAAGGVASGAQWLACEALGAEGVQIGSLFALSEESSAHPSFKELCVGLGEGSTMLSLKSLVPARLVRNDFYDLVSAAEARGASVEELREILGRGRARRGMFEGDLSQGELEIGQVVSSINRVDSVSDIVSRLVSEYNQARESLLSE